MFKSTFSKYMLAFIAIILISFLILSGIITSMIRTYSTEEKEKQLFSTSTAIAFQIERTEVEQLESYVSSGVASQIIAPLIIRDSAIDILVVSTDSRILMTTLGVEPDENGIRIPQQCLRYTAGTFDLTIGNQTFETVKFMILQKDIFKEFFVDRSGRLILMRWYQSQTGISLDGRYPQEFKECIRNNPHVTVNGKKYILIEDRLNEYVFSLS